MPQKYDWTPVDPLIRQGVAPSEIERRLLAAGHLNVPTASTIAVHKSRMEGKVPRLRARYDDLVPWELGSRGNHRIVKRLRAISKVRRRADVEPYEAIRGERFADWLRGQGLVVAYFPDERDDALCFKLVPPRPGIDTDLIRKPVPSVVDLRDTPDDVIQLDSAGDQASTGDRQADSPI